MSIKGISVPALSLGLFAATAGALPLGAELSYFGRASVKIRTATGLVIYIDPYAPGDYSEPADLILVTHGHGDHNQVKLVARKPGTVLAAPAGAVSERGALAVSEGQVFTAGPAGEISITVLPASNRNHPRKECVGYLASFDGIVVYHAGDTNRLPEMAGYAKYGIGYALLPCDGFYNMGPAEASQCAADIKAKHVLPIHSSKDGYFGEKNARAVTGQAVIVLKPGDEVGLEP
jgi:L-ascorbate metabolism protein UlaG (beta-lactamase superfamily)